MKPEMTTMMAPNASKYEPLPTSEFFHPIPMTAITVMAINDHLLKGSGLLPGVITGKLSDICGMLFFPLFMTATIDTVIFGFNGLSARLGYKPRISHRLSHPKLVLAVIATGVGFAALQLSPDFVRFYAAFHQLVGMTVHVTRDPTDLIALPSLLVSYMVGRRTIQSSRNSPEPFLVESQQSIPYQ